MLQISEYVVYTKIVMVENLTTFKAMLSMLMFVSLVAVFGDLDRFVLSISYMKRCTMYWIKLVSMSKHRYPRKLYKMLFQLDEVSRKTWVTCIGVLLYFLIF